MSSVMSVAIPSDVCCYMSVAILPDVSCYVSYYPARYLVLCGQWLSCHMSGVMWSVAILPDVWCYVDSGYLVRCLVLCQ